MIEKVLKMQMEMEISNTTETEHCHSYPVVLEDLKEEQ